MVSPGGRPVKVEIRAAAGVVFPIPMSPVTSRSTTALDELLGDAGPAHHRPGGLLPAHRHATAYVVRSGFLLRCSQERVSLQIRGHPHVEYAKANADGSGEDVHRCTPGAEVLDHRCGDLFGPGRDAALEDAVIPGRDHDRGALEERRRNLPGHPREPRAELLQAPETTRRFGEPRVPLSRRVRCGFVWRPDFPGELPHLVFEGHRSVVMVAVVVARLVGVVVGRGGGADLLLEAGEGDPVDADVAVHPDVAA